MFCFILDLVAILVKETASRIFSRSNRFWAEHQGSWVDTRNHRDFFLAEQATYLLEIISCTVESVRLGYKFILHINTSPHTSFLKSFDEI